MLLNNGLYLYPISKAKAEGTRRDIATVHSGIMMIMPKLKLIPIAHCSFGFCSVCLFGCCSCSTGTGSNIKCNSST